MTDGPMPIPDIEPAEAFDETPGLIYLDSATHGLPPRATVAAIREALDSWSSGIADWIEDWDRPAEETRADFATLTGVPESSVALIPAVSVGAGLIAATLGPGDEVLVPEDEFTSVSYPFQVAEQRGASVRRAPIGALAESIGPATTLVATSLVQMQTGLRADLPAIRAAADEVGARVMLDATQAIPFLREDERLADVDYVLAHGYKHLMCPRGATFMAIRPDRIAGLAPANANWRSAREPYGQYFSDVLELGAEARAFDVSLAWFSWVGARISVGLLRRWQASGSLAPVWALAERLSTEAGLGPAASTLVCVPVDGAAAAAIALRDAGIKASVRGVAVRLAVHAWNTDADIDRALEVLAPFRAP